MSGAPRPSETAALQAELLARLGLPSGASPEQIDDVHYAVSQYLSAAPAGLRTWAHAQAAALDEAYLLLTDPAGLQGSALRSPTRPPTVVPGGPATPPVRRGLPAAVFAAASPVAADDAAATEDEADEAVDFETLYASVTPSAHAEMGPEILTAAERNRRKRAEQARLRAAAATQVVAAAPSAAPNPWKRFALVLGGVIAIVAILFVGFSLGGGGGKPAASSPIAQASPTAPAIDEAKVAALMAKLQANPKDLATLLALGDEYYAGERYADAASFYDQLLAIDPKNVQGLLARGAVYFNTNDLTNAEKVWRQVAILEPNNQEVHYDLGFLYLNQPTPNFAGVQTEWYAVIKIDPTTSLAKTVQSHLDSMVAGSMIPGTPAPSGSASGSPAPSGSPAASPAASTSGSVVNQTALNLKFGSATLNAPANQAFTIHFDNQEAGLPHDIQISDPAGNVFFKGETVTGPKAIDYAVKSLPAGSYPFSCSIHPTMTGTLVVGS